MGWREGLVGLGSNGKDGVGVGDLVVFSKVALRWCSYSTWLRRVRRRVFAGCALQQI